MRADSIEFEATLYLDSRKLFFVGLSDSKPTPGERLEVVSVLCEAADGKQSFMGKALQCRPLAQAALR